MDVDLRAGIVRILKPDGATAGTGFVVNNEGLVATCAHVVQYAGAGPGDRVRVVFRATGETQEAEVASEYWRSPDAEDVAVLHLENLPEGVTPLPLGSSGGTSTHHFKAYGFPEAKGTEGMWGYGLLGDKTTESGFEVLQLTGTTEVTVGFSGGPVLDIAARRVVGMVTSITHPDEYGRLAETAFVIPTETLRALCSLLRLSDICPYQGLAAFAEPDAEFFFGREKLIADLLSHLRRNPRFLAVIGPSGSGKSSVIQAGLFPALRRGDAPGSQAWDLLTFRPGADPFGALASAGLQADTTTELQLAVQAYLDEHPTAERLVMFADQFEELFALCPETVRTPFLSQLLALLDSKLHITLILALRADFYGHLLTQRPLSEQLALNQVNVAPMEGAELQAAVREPANKVGLSLEPGLVEMIVEEASQVKHPLPLLEAALTELWKRRQEGTLTHDAYQRVGRVAGAITQWAEDTYSGLNQEEQPLAQRIFTRLSYYSEVAAADTRRRQSMSELLAHSEEQESIHHLIQRLADARLLVTDRDPGTEEKTAEIIHDVLLQEWGRLRKWRTDQRDFYLWRQRLGERLRNWEEKKQDQGALLQGADLKEAQHWLKKSDDLNPREQEYIKESATLRKRTIRRFMVGLTAGLLLVVAVLYLWLSASYYFSTSDSSGIVIRAGHPGLKLLPGLDQVVVVTGYSLQDVADPTLISAERLSSFRFRRSEGYAYWGEQLFSHLEHAQAGLAYWRVGDSEQAFARLAQGVASGDVESVKVAGYLAIQSETAIERTVEILIAALQGDEEMHQAALTTLVIVRDTQPNATEIQLESLTARLQTTTGAEMVAVAEAIGVLSVDDQAANSLILTKLLSTYRTTANENIQLLVARALDNILRQQPDLLPAILPDIVEFVRTGHGEVHQVLVAILGMISSTDPTAQTLAIQAALEVLEDDDPKARIAAVTALGHLIPDATSSLTSDYMSALLSMADDSDDEVRAALAEALALFPVGFVEQPDVLQTARSLAIEDKSQNVRYKATQALANMYDGNTNSQVITALTAAAGDINGLVRWGAVHALVEVGMTRPEGIEQIEGALRAALDDGSPDVRQEAAQGLLLLADQIKGDLTPALDEFILALTSDDWQQVEVAEQLAQRFAPDSQETAPSSEAAAIIAEQLVPYALEANQQGADKVIDFLVIIGENQAQALAQVVGAMVDLLAADEVTSLADNALWRLRNLPPAHLEPALADLFEQLNSPSPTERSTAARATGWLSVEYEDLAALAITKLLSRFTDPEIHVRVEVAFSLGLIGQKQPQAIQPALDPLVDCVASEQPAIRAACAGALAQIAAGEKPPTDAIISPLLAALQDPNPEVRREAAKALSYLAGEAPEAAQSAIEPLRMALSAESVPQVRLDIGSALGALGGEDPGIASEVIMLAKAAFASSDVDLREQAIWCLRDLGKQQHTAAKNVLEALSPMLADPDLSLRRQAILAIRDIGISKALSAEAALVTLTPALAYPDSQTRWDAIGNGIGPIVRSQPVSAATAVSLLNGLLDDETLLAYDEYGVVQSEAWDTLTVAYATLAMDNPEILWPLITASSASERAAGREALMLTVAKHPDLLVRIRDDLADLRLDWRPHVRQSAALVEEMVVIVQSTQTALSDQVAAERWYKVLEWLPAVGVDAARDFARSQIQELYPTDQRRNHLEIG